MRPVRQLMSQRKESGVVQRLYTTVVNLPQSAIIGSPVGTTEPTRSRTPKNFIDDARRTTATNDSAEFPDRAVHQPANRERLLSSSLVRETRTAQLTGELESASASNATQPKIPDEFVERSPSSSNRKPRRTSSALDFRG